MWPPVAHSVAPLLVEPGLPLPGQQRHSSSEWPVVAVVAPEVGSDFPGDPEFGARI